MSDLPARLSLREVGPRDGLQNEDPVPTAGKVALIDALSPTGVGRIEAVSYVHPRAVPAMADADEVWQQVERRPDVPFPALVPDLRGAQRALAAGFRKIEVVVSASDTHNRANLNRSTAESLDDNAALLQAAHDADATCQVWWPRPSAARTRGTSRSSGCCRWRSGRWRTARTPCPTATPPAWRRRGASRRWWARRACACRTRL